MKYHQNNTSISLTESPLNCIHLHRFGFNGKEKDDEWTGSTGSHLDFGARIYDARIGRWLACDPLAIKYPNLSPYQYTANNPILFVDPDGKLIRIYMTNGGYYDYTPGQEVTTDDVNVLKVVEAIQYNMHTPIGDNVWTTLGSADQVIEIRITNNESDYKGENLGKATEDNKISLGTIYWNCNQSLEVLTTGGVDADVFGGGVIKGYFSPSTSLIHEGGHGLEALIAYLSGKTEEFASTMMENNDFGFDEQYDTKEERRNIRDVEREYIREINKWEIEHNENPQLQPLRYNHDARESSKSSVNDVNKVYNSNTYKEWRKNREAEGQTENDVKR